MDWEDIIKNGLWYGSGIALGVWVLGTNASQVKTLELKVTRLEEAKELLVESQENDVTFVYHNTETGQDLEVQMPALDRTQGNVWDRNNNSFEYIGPRVFTP